MNVQFSQCVKEKLGLRTLSRSAGFENISKYSILPFPVFKYIFTFPGGKVKSSPKTSALKLGGSSVHQWLHNTSGLSFTDVTAVGLSGCFGITVASLVFSTIFFNFFSLSYYFSSPGFQYLFIKLWRKTRTCYYNMYLIGQTQECDILQWEL